MSENQMKGQVPPAATAGLRERQLVFMHATDQRILNHANTLAETLQFIVSETQRILDARHVDILFEYPDGLRNEISSDAAEIGAFIPFDGSISGLVLAQGYAIVANDIRNDPLLRDRYFPRRGVDLRDAHRRLNVLAADITLDGRAVGVFNVEGSSQDDLGESHLEFIRAAAGLVSVALAHAALFDEDTFRAATDTLLLSDTSVSSDVIMRQVLDHILEALRSLAFLGPDAAEILFTDPLDDGALLVAFSTNEADIGIRVGVGSSVCGEAFRTRDTVVLQRALEHEDYRPIQEGMRCEIAVPISLGGALRFPIGVLNIESVRENAFSNVARVLVERFARRVMNVVAMTKIRADLDNTLQDQLLVLAADQVLNAVHRINNHVGSVRAVAADLIEDLDSPMGVDRSELKHRLRHIYQDAERALEIPDELRKRIGGPEESVDINAQVMAGAGAVRIPKGVRLATSLATGLPSLPCTALDLVVENLILNAVQAMRNEPGHIRVTTSLDLRLPREPCVVVSIEDDGVGMSKAQIEKLFEPRRRGHGGGGLGFGMVWVRGWVRRAQGLIDVESEPDVGTKVSIRFQIDPELLNSESDGGVTE